MDLLLGTWAARFVPSLSAAELSQYEALLNRETLDLYNWVTGREPPPPELAGPLLDGIVAWVRAQPLGRASQEVGGRGGGRGPLELPRNYRCHWQANGMRDDAHPRPPLLLPLSTPTALPSLCRDTSQ